MVIEDLAKQSAANKTDAVMGKKKGYDNVQLSECSDDEEESKNDSASNQKKKTGKRSKKPSKGSQEPSKESKEVVKGAAGSKKLKAKKQEDGDGNSKAATVVTEKKKDTQMTWPNEKTAKSVKNSVVENVKNEDSKQNNETLQTNSSTPKKSENSAEHLPTVSAAPTTVSNPAPSRPIRPTSAAPKRAKKQGCCIIV